MSSSSFGDRFMDGVKGGLMFSSPQLAGYVNHESLQQVQQQQSETQEQLNLLGSRLERIEAMLAKIAPSTQIQNPQKQGMVAQPQQTRTTEHAR